MNREGQAYAMSHTQQDHDYLALHTKPEMQEFFARSGETKVLFSGTVQKMNRKGKVQARTVCVTDVNIYNLDQKLKISWSKPLLALRLAVTTPVQHGILFCFDGAAAGADGAVGPGQVARENKGKLKKIKSVGKTKQFEYLLFGCEAADVAAALQEVVALNAPVEVPFLSCHSSADISGLQQAHPALLGAPLPLWFAQEVGVPQVIASADAAPGSSVDSTGVAQYPQTVQHAQPMQPPMQPMQQYGGQRYMQQPGYGQQQPQQMPQMPQMPPQGNHMYAQHYTQPPQQPQPPQHMSSGNNWLQQSY